MEGMFLSNINAFGRSEGSKQSKEALIQERLEDAKAMLGENPMIVSAWNDPGKAPDCSIDYFRYMIDQQSEINSSFINTNSVRTGQAQAVLPIYLPDELKKNYAKGDNWLSAIAIGAEGYDMSGTKEIHGSSLLLWIVGFDSTSGCPIVRAVNGKYQNGGIVMPGIDKGTRIVITKGFFNPYVDVSSQFNQNSDISLINFVEIDPKSLNVSPVNTVILDADCPAVRQDAKRNDVFLFVGGYYHSLFPNFMASFIKCYTFGEKVAALMRQPDKLITRPGQSKEKSRVYMVSKFDEEVRGATADAYIFTLDTIAVESEDEDEEARFYRKGALIFNDATAETLIEMPFDIFFQ